jgi:hypothetical protein
MEPKPPVTSWVKTGGICGLIGGCMYFLAAFVNMPAVLKYAAAYSFAPLLAIGCAGLFVFFSGADNKPRFRKAWITATAGVLLLLAMMTVQQTIFSDLQQFPKATYGAINPDGEQVGIGLAAVQPILDIACEIFITTALFLFAFSMLRQTWFWKITGATGFVLALLLVLSNFYTFGIPSIETESINWGPFVAIWLLFVFATLLTSRDKPQEFVNETAPEVSRAHYY